MGFVVDEVAHVLLYEFVVLAGVAAVVSFLEAREVFGFGTVVFAYGEAATLSAEQLAVYGFDYGRRSSPLATPNTVKASLVLERKKLS